MRDEPLDHVTSMRHFIREVQEEGRLDLIETYVHPDFRDRTPEADQPTGRDGVYDIMRALHSALEDIRITVVHCVSRGDVVATHKVVRGRHVGEWLGDQPTGNFIELRIMDFMRIQDGRLIEHWSVLNPLTDTPD